MGLGLNELALFAGAGGGLLGSQLLGWRTVCAVELDPYARNVLLARQDDGCFEPFAVWDDVRTFDGRPWAGLVDVVTGGFPCTDIAVCRQDAEGIEGEASGLWVEFARIIGEVVPRFVFVENSAALTARGLGSVLGDLASMGFDAEWGVIGANHAGAPHRRDRMWIVGMADAERTRLEGRGDAGQSEKREPRHGSASSEPLETVYGMPGLLVREASDARARLRVPADRGVGDKPVLDWWEAEPDVGRMVDGVAHRVDRLKCIGNGQVPSVAALAWRTLLDRMGES